MRELGRRTAWWLVAAAALAACSLPGDKDEDSMDLTRLESAVVAASPRVTGIELSERGVDGLGHDLTMDLRLDTDAPPTSEELDEIVEAIWRNVPWEPNGINLVVGDVDTGDLPVDLEDGAAALEPMRFNSFGQGGVSLVRLEARYGEWQEPA